MKKKARLDQILLRLGYVTQAQITQALARQKTKGGRLGSHLVHLGSLTDAQLVEALAAQFDLPWVASWDREIDAALVRRVPPGMVLERMVVPLESGRGSLTLLVADPLDREAVDRVKEALGADRVVVMLAPERVVLELGELYLGGARPAAPSGVELPELFEVEAPHPTLVELDEAEESGTRVLMVIEGAAHKNFLPPVFQKEAADLVVVSSAEDCRDAMQGPAFDAILVARPLLETFSGWVRDHRVPTPSAEVSVFPSISGSLLENPAPYDITVRSLRVAVQAVADERGKRLGAAPPYGLMAEDLDAIARRYGLRRLARDGLNLGVHLLVPTRGEADEGATGPFAEFPGSLEMAASLRFPFRIDALLGVCHALFRGRVKPDTVGHWGEEVHLAAQMLALVWYRHTIVAPSDEARGGVPGAALRGEAGGLASLELIEVYLRIIADRGESATERNDRDVLLVGSERISRTLAARLRRVGCRTLEARDLTDARTMVARQVPAAIVIDHDEFEEATGAFCAWLTREHDLLAYVLTDSTDASKTLALLDAGADDVFAPPHEFDLVSARISRAVRARARYRTGEPGATAGGQFSASFEIFSFLDLVQTLSHSRKSARIEIRRDNGESATVFTHGGRVIHAACGELLGEEAVFRVITWEDDGTFVVYPETDPPAPTIHVATDGVLMEGCRLLDESKV